MADENELVVLIDDDADNATSNGSGSAANVAISISPSSTESSPPRHNLPTASAASRSAAELLLTSREEDDDPIIVSGGSSSTDVAAVAAAASAPSRRGTRKSARQATVGQRKSPRASKKPPSTEVACVPDEAKRAAEEVNSTATDANRYFQALGPIRMAFLSDWSTVLEPSDDATPPPEPEVPPPPPPEPTIGAGMMSLAASSALADSFLLGSLFPPPFATPLVATGIGTAAASVSLPQMVPPNMAGLPDPFMGLLQSYSLGGGGAAAAAAALLGHTSGPTGLPSISSLLAPGSALSALQPGVAAAALLATNRHRPVRDAASTVVRHGTPHVYEHLPAMAPMARKYRQAEPISRSDPKVLYPEFLAYQLNLPVTPSSSILVRVQDSRLDLLRALITGPEGTPYAYGCFFFDLFLPDYPQRPPKVQFLTTGQGRARFNPNLYECGKVCLSLLGTWSGPGWIPNQSTILQVLVSIQGLILVSDPYFNEPAYETARGSRTGQKMSEAYNKNIRRYTVQYAIATPLQQAADTYQSSVKAAEAAAAAETQVAASKTEADNETNETADDEKPASSTEAPRKGRNSFSFPEFAQAVVRHFALQAEALKAQLAEWAKEDEYLLNWIPIIDKNLTVVMTAYEHDLQNPSSMDDVGDSTVTFSRKRARTTEKRAAPAQRPDQEVIDLLDD